ncbi:hypothetical protein CHS0354_023229 [Potamilus streckersoni]|uniref:Laminin G domain-containing protein n=1 Tax=Potamilus streckersoni TaxID=2493646 RepID=A0AAE0SJR0_9BIVA|nr:hypothetical protein CHS0354_023229 [Potamilus streckersoni]
MVQEVCFVLIAVIGSVLARGPCFRFYGNGSLVFEDNLDIASSASFEFEFETKNDGGLIYYAEGLYQKEIAYDFEGLFLSDGILHYFLFNPTEFGVGSTFGFHGSSRNKLNDGKWHKVRFFRNIEMEEKVDGKKTKVLVTGLVVDDDVVTKDPRERRRLHLGNTLWIGGNSQLQERMGNGIGGFKGRIRNFMETRLNHVFETSSRNIDVKRCTE